MFYNYGYRNKLSVSAASDDTHNDSRGLFLKRWAKGESLTVLEGSEMNSRL